jgi:hypothetical protein
VAVGKQPGAVVHLGQWEAEPWSGESEKEGAAAAAAAAWMGILQAGLRQKTNDRCGGCVV